MSLVGYLNDTCDSITGLIVINNGTTACFCNLFGATSWTDKPSIVPGSLPIAADKAIHLSVIPSPNLPWRSVLTAPSVCAHHLSELERLGDKDLMPSQPSKLRRLYRPWLEASSGELSVDTERKRARNAAEFGQIHWAQFKGEVANMGHGLWFSKADSYLLIFQKRNSICNIFAVQMSH